MRPSVVIPTKHRAPYLDVALRSLAPQVAEHGGELVVVDDGPDDATREAAARHGAAYVALTARHGLNAARNAGIDATSGELVAFVDDDIEALPGWLAALLDGAARNGAHEAFAGRIVARFEGFQPRLCGREGPPVTTLDLGPEERDAPHAWGANFAVRRSAVERVGRFDESIGGSGDEQEWQSRLLAAGGRIRWLPAATLVHRRAGADAHVGALARAARFRGQAARREDVMKGTAPGVAHELRVLVGSLAHGPRFRCANGPISTAHSIGRLEQALRPTPGADVDDFLAGVSGTVGGRRGQARAVADAVLDLLPWRRGPRASERRRVLVLGIERPGSRMRALRDELERSGHDVIVRTSGPGERGKFENLNALLNPAHSDRGTVSADARRRDGEAASHEGGGAAPLASFDWLLVVDDDVVLPPAFLDRFLALAERYQLKLAQPAHRLTSHAAWAVTRRRPASLVRETPFVEIGPITAFHRDTFAVLLPFPPLRMGWGLDVHWGAVAREHGWRIGVVDATPILHTVPSAQTYGREQAIAEARAFLADRPYVPRDDANRTLRTHR